MSREVWKKHDRERPSCPDCGAELFDAFWGNGGWVPTEKDTDRTHGPEDCVRRLKAKLAHETERFDARFPEGVNVTTQRDKP